MKIIIVADESSLVTAKHNKEPLIKSCFNMFKEYWSIKDILVQCPVKIAEKIKKILPKAQIYTEPVKKGTAAAVGLAAIRIALQNPDEVVIVSYSDHPVKYRHKLHSALKVAQTLFNHWKKLILIGVNPTFPATDYGYAQIGKVLQEINGTIAFEMVGFKEKPQKELAEKFLQSWRYLWNTGYLVCGVNTLLKKYQHLLPDLYKGLQLIKEAIGTSLEQQISSTVFANLPKISIDKGIYEKIPRDEVAIIPVDLNIHDFSDY